MLKKNIKFLLVSSMLISGILLPTHSIHALWWPFNATKTEQSAEVEKKSNETKAYLASALNTLNNNAWSLVKKGTSLAADGIGKATKVFYNNLGTTTAVAGSLAAYSTANSYLNQKAKNKAVEKVLESAVVGASKNGFHIVLNGAHTGIDLAGNGVIGSAKLAWDHPVPTAILIGGCVVYNYRNEIKKQAEQTYNYCKDGAIHAAKQAINYCKNNAGNVVMGAGAVSTLAGAAGLAHEAYKNWQSNAPANNRVPSVIAAQQSNEQKEKNNNIDSADNKFDTLVEDVENFLQDYNKPTAPTEPITEVSEIEPKAPESIHSPLPKNPSTSAVVEEDVQEFTRDNRPGVSPATQMVNMRASSIKNDTPPHVTETGLPEKGDFHGQRANTSSEQADTYLSGLEKGLKGYLMKNYKPSNSSLLTSEKSSPDADKKQPVKSITSPSSTNNDVYERAARRLEVIWKHFQHAGENPSNAMDTSKSALSAYQEVSTKVPSLKVVSTSDRPSSPVQKIRARF